jgi:hypothetical protein
MSGSMYLFLMQVSATDMVSWVPSLMFLAARTIASHRHQPIALHQTQSAFGERGILDRHLRRTPTVVCCVCRLLSRPMGLWANACEQMYIDI